MTDSGLHVEKLQAEILTIAQTLQRKERAKSIVDLWERALSLHRAKYDKRRYPWDGCERGPARLKGSRALSLCGVVRPAAAHGRPS